MDRRAFLTGLGLAAAGPCVLQSLWARQSGVLPVYAAAGPELTQYDLDVARGTLTTRVSVTVPANVQEAWPHPTLRLLYAAWSDGASGTRHGVSVFRVDTETGALTLAAAPTVLARRPIYLTLDRTGRYLLIAYNLPSGMTVHSLADDGAIGAAMTQADGLDFGTYAHQVRMAPSNRFVVLPTRGNEPTAASTEDPGALKVFRFADGHLSPLTSVATDAGRAFRARHVDFHPSGRWMYLTLESQNRLLTFGVSDVGISPAPLFDTTTLATSAAVPQQTTSTVHVHPTGQFVYVGNRSIGVTTRNGVPAVAGGENSIAAFAIDARTGEPTRIHNVDTAGIQPRTFMLDPSGRSLVVANQTVLNDAAGRVLIPASLSTFHVGSDGRLTFVRKYDVGATNQRSLFWVGSFGR